MYYETEKIELKEKVTDVLVKEIESFLNTDESESNDLSYNSLDLK